MDRTQNTGTVQAGIIPVFLLYLERLGFCKKQQGGTERHRPVYFENQIISSQRRYRLR